MIRWIAAVGFTLCTQMAMADRVVVAGDDIMGPHLGPDASVAAALSQLLDEPVANLAITDATMLEGEIPGQISDTPADVIVLSGGFNDFLGICWDRARIMVAMDRIIYADGGRGGIPNLAEASTAQIVFVGPPRAAQPIRDFVECHQMFTLFDNRLATLDAMNDRFHFVSLADLNPSRDATFYLDDGIRPSASGVFQIAQRIADVMDDRGLATCASC